MTIQCKNCSRSTTRDEQTARLNGWVIWSGETRGGQHVDRVFCPGCAGRQRPDDTTAPTWDAECRTCYARMSEDWDDDSPFSEKDARDWRRGHECEPDVRIIQPEEIEKERQRIAESRKRYAAKAGS